MGEKILSALGWFFVLGLSFGAFGAACGAYIADYHVILGAVLWAVLSLIGAVITALVGDRLYGEDE